MTKTPQQIKKEVGKGCGDTVVFDDDITPPCRCGRLVGDVIFLCDDCSAKLSILTEYDKSIKEMIEELKENRLNCRECGCSCPDELINELLSKIGDNSEVKQ